MVISEQLITIAEFEERTAHSEALLELINGRVVEKVTSEEHGKIVINIASELRNWQRRTKFKGHYSTETTFRAADDVHNSRRPDVAFRRTDDAVSSAASLDTMPDFAVEVKSPSNTYDELREKARFYLQHGAKLVWLVYPAKRVVEVYNADGSELFLENETLEGDDVLPNFTLAVQDIFAL